MRKEKVEHSLQPCQSSERPDDAHPDSCSPMKKNLILVMDTRLDAADIYDVANRIVGMDHNIAVHLVSAQENADSLPAEVWKRPSVTVGFGPAANFVPPRGPIFENRPTEKLEQYKRLCAAGIPTPRTERFEFGKHYDEKDWSEFVILKPLPLTLSSRKGWTRLYRTHRLEHLKAHELPGDHFLRKGPGLVQTLIDTGSHPAKYRVLSLFGEALYGSMTRSAVPRVSLDASDEELESSVIDAKNPKSTIADTAGERNRLVTDEDVLALARRVHAVFPRIPYLGIDILRRQSDGCLFALEVNAGGNTWHFPSRKDAHRNRLGGRQAMVDQFGAWTVAAKVLIQLAHAHAS
jgi:hypothetical protein